MRLRLFAWGARGVGPLQQYLWLEEWYDKIQPDFILWQFCFNDVFNSSYELENTSYFNNNHRSRPYLENDRIVYRTPARLGLSGIRESSKSLDFILTKIEGILESRDHKTGRASEDLVIKEGKKYQPYQDGLITVDQVLKKIKTITQQTPILAMQADLTEPFASDTRAIFEANGIAASHSAATIISQKMENNESVLAKDLGHWNETGHAIAAQEIWPHLKAMIYSDESKLTN